MSGKPTKKDFANLINSVLGEDVMTEQKLDRILREAKQANDSQGSDGLFDYLRELTNAPVSNDQIRNIANMVKNSGGSDQALQSLKNQKLINDQQASQINQIFNKKKRRRRRNR